MIAGVFVLGEVCALQFKTEPAAGVLLFFAAAFGLLMINRCLKAKADSQAAKAWLLLLCVFLAGSLRMKIEQDSWDRVEERLDRLERAQSVTGKIKDIHEKGGQLVITIRTKAIKEVMVYLEEQTPVPLQVGMTIRADGSFSRPRRASNPGQFDQQAYYRGINVSALFFAAEIAVLEAGHSPYFQGLLKARQFLSGLLERYADEQDAGIYKAAVLGEKQDLDQEIKRIFQRTGIAHILAISGLHLSLLGMGLYRMIRKTGLGFGAAGILSALLMVSYAWLTGGSYSAVRALLMMGMFFLASYLGRTYDLLTGMAAALLLLAVKQPFLLTLGGFQLSFGAVFGIGYMGRRLIFIFGVQQGWKQSILVSVGIQLATFPVLLWHYFQYPVYGIWLNFLVVPLMGYVIYSALAGMALGVAVPDTAAADFAFGPGHYLLNWFEWISSRFDRLPFSQLCWGRPQKLQVVCYYVLLMGALAWLGAAGGKTAGRKSRAAAAGMILLSVLCLAPLPWKGIRTFFLDVGQGDGIVLLVRDTYLSDTRAVLIDGGSSSEKRLGENCLEPFLKSQGIRKLDYAIVSHGDQDHISGLRYLLTESRDIRVEKVVLPLGAKAAGTEERLIQEAARHGADIYYMKQWDKLSVGGLELLCLYPGEEPGRVETDRNQHSLIFTARYGAFGMLFTGDADAMGEEKMIEAVKQAGREQALTGVRLLKIAHHGSKHSSHNVFLEYLDPAYGVVSYGAGNSYGHPHQETLDRLAENGITLFETAKTGAVTFTSDGKSHFSYYLFRVGNFF